MVSQSIREFYPALPVLVLTAQFFIQAAQLPTARVTRAVEMVLQPIQTPAAVAVAHTAWAARVLPVAPATADSAARMTWWTAGCRDMLAAAAVRMERWQAA